MLDALMTMLEEPLDQLNGLFGDVSQQVADLDISIWQLAPVVTLVVCISTIYWYVLGRRSPFYEEPMPSKKTIETNQGRRDEVLKKAFSERRVPQNLDAIVIGSGIGGLSAAALLAKVGKKVLVLEQHDKAGGYCHSYAQKGFQFEVRNNIIGQMHENSMMRIALEQITEGQLDFAPLDQPFETFYIGQGEATRKYTVCSGKTDMEAHLKQQFPNDTETIESFFQVMKVAAKETYYLAALKIMPRWMARFVLWTGIAQSSVYLYATTSVTAWLDQLTSNKDLHAILSFLFYGASPKDSSLFLNALIFQHFKRGAYFPKGGASEIPYHISNTIRKYGGEVLVSAPVSRVLLDKNGTAYGVAVGRGHDEVEVKAPIVISDCGILNTYKNILPPQISLKHDILDRDGVKAARAIFLVFCGFDATAEEIGAVSTNTRLYKDNDLNQILERYFNMYQEEAPDNLPYLSITFTSVMDPTGATRNPGKTSMTLMTMVNYDWFAQWENGATNDEYEQYKMRFADVMVDWACQHFPKLKEKMVFQEVYTPLNNNEVLGAYKGSRGVHPGMHMFEPLIMAKNRCDTPVKNLYITGKDVFSDGIIGSLSGAILCVSTILNHVLFWDLLLLKKKLKRNKAKQDALHSKKLL